MILDTQNQFSSNQALAATAVSTNVIDLSEARQIQQGEQLGILLTVSTAADHTTGDETYQVDLQTDSAVGFGTLTTIQSFVIPAAQLTLGARLFFPLADGLASFKEFIRLNYTLGGTTPSVTLSAYLQPQSMVDEQTLYKSGFTVQ
jgi:hypothetical protein